MVTGHLEIETKYDVDDAFVLPGLADVAEVDPPVEHLLDAVYHDTADLRLLQARVTLRRRTGGPDAGWHLKLPAGTARRELHAPLGRAVKKAPRALLGPVTGILRGAVPEPVVLLHTRRVVTALRNGDGQVLAEVADDTVTATLAAAGPGEPAQVRAWREVEVELVDGDEALAAAVGERLVAAGARPSESASKVGRVLADRLAPAPRRKGKKQRAGDQVLDALRGQVAALQAADVLLRTEQTDAVHQLRVADRRLRSILAAFRGVLDPAVTTPLRDELAWFGGQLAGARDDEVALAHLSALVAAEPVELVLGPVAARLQQTEIALGAAGVDRAVATVAEPRYLALLDALHALLADPPVTARADEPFRSVLQDAARRAGKRLRRRLRTAERADDDERPEALHDVRTAVKRLRYVAELADGKSTGVRSLARAAKRAQQVLVEVQDSVVTREHCRRLALTALAAGENSFAYGRLHALEQARAERAEAEFWCLEPDLRRLLRRA